nr:transposase family protein [Nocardiopsis sp. JB363]
MFCPFEGRGKPQRKKDANSTHAKLRSPGERAIAQLKNWKVLRRLRCCPQRAGQITRAVLVLQLREAG